MGLLFDGIMLLRHYQALKMDHSYIAEFGIVMINISFEKPTNTIHTTMMFGILISID